MWRKINASNDKNLYTGKTPFAVINQLSFWARMVVVMGGATRVSECEVFFNDILFSLFLLERLRRLRGKIKVYNNFE